MAFVLSLKRLSMACLLTEAPCCDKSMQYSDSDGLLFWLQKKTVSRKPLGEMVDLRFMKPDDVAIDSRCSSETIVDR